MARGLAGPRDGLQRVERAIQQFDGALATGDAGAVSRAAANLRTELMLAEQELKARGAALDSLRLRAEALLHRA